MAIVKDKGSIKERLNRQLTTEEIMNIFLYLIVLVMPFIIFIWEKEVYHRAGKVPMIYMVGAILLIFLIKDRFKNIHIEGKVALLFLGTIFVSAILSPYKSIAFFGNESRNEGFIMIAMYIVFFIVATKYLSINKKILTICLCVANVMALYSIMQFYGFDIVRGIIANNYRGEGVLGTIGNRNFLSTYMLIFLFIALGLYIFYGVKRYYLLSLPIFAALLCSQTRGGWVAFAIYSALGLIMILKRKHCLIRSLVIFLSYILIFATLNVTSGGKIAGRMDSLVNDISTTINVVTDKGKENKVEVIDKLGSNRGGIWKIALDLYKESPIIGTGPDTFAIRLYNEKPDVIINQVKTTKGYVDKAHNEFLEYVMNCGIFTLILYVILILLILKELWKKRGNDKFKVMMLFIIGYLVQSFFNISVIMVAPIFWIVLGGIVHEYKKI